MTPDDEIKALLDALENPNTPDVPEERNPKVREIVLFTRAFNIRQGKSAIPQNLIYDSYVQWSPNPMSIRTFAKVFSQFFKKKRTSKNFFYFLEPDSFNLPENYTCWTDPNFQSRRNVQPLIEYLGVYQYPNGKIVARITIPDGTTRSLGNFRTCRQAAIAYDKAVLEMYGPKAAVNFPGRWEKKAYHGHEKATKETNED